MPQKSEECISLLNACEEAINTTNSIPWDPKWLRFIAVWENAQEVYGNIEELSDEEKKLMNFSMENLGSRMMTKMELIFG